MDEYKADMALDGDQLKERETIMQVKCIYRSSKLTFIENSVKRRGEKTCTSTNKIRSFIKVSDLVFRTNIQNLWMLDGGTSRGNKIRLKYSRIEQKTRLRSTSFSDSITQKTFYNPERDKV